MVTRMTLLHRLAHRLLGWEYVVIHGRRHREFREPVACDLVRRVREYVDGDIDVYGELLFANVSATLRDDGTFKSISYSPPFLPTGTWKPLTPGVARFYKGEE